MGTEARVGGGEGAAVILPELDVRVVELGGQPPVLGLNMHQFPFHGLRLIFRQLALRLIELYAHIFLLIFLLLNDNLGGIELFAEL